MLRGILVSAWGQRITAGIAARGIGRNSARCLSILVLVHSFRIPKQELQPKIHRNGRENVQ
jgi:hypothetical protein